MSLRETVCSGRGRDAGWHVSGCGTSAPKNEIIQDRPADRWRRTRSALPGGHRNRTPAREQVGRRERRHRARGVAHERVARPARSAPTNSSSRHFSSGRENPSRQQPDVRERAHLAAASRRRRAILRAMCSSRRDLLRREVGALEERAPVLEVAVARSPRAGRRTAARPVAQQRPACCSFSSCVARRGGAGRAAARAEDLVGRDHHRVREVERRLGGMAWGCGPRGRRAPARRA